MRCVCVGVCLQAYQLTDDGIPVAVTRAGNGEVTPSSVSFLGLVLTLEDLAIYAMVTNTKLRILLLLSPGESRVRDLDCLTVRARSAAAEVTNEQLII